MTFCSQDRPMTAKGSVTMPEPSIVGVMLKRVIGVISAETTLLHCRGCRNLSTLEQYIERKSAPEVSF